MGDVVKILFCMALFVLLTQCANLSNGDDLGSESRFQNVSERAVQGAVVSRKKRAIFTTALSILAAMGGLAGAGAGIASAVTDTGEVMIMVAIDVENRSKWRLGSPVIHLESGKIKTPAANISPGGREIMVARKTSVTATGSFGTVSWVVENNRQERGGVISRQRIIIMWSVPFDYNLYSNWLAVGIIDEDDVGPQWTWRMCNGPQGPNFRRREYDDSVSIIEFCDDTMCLTGTMGNVHRTTVDITLVPINENNLAVQRDTH